ncbi:DUF2569 family protein [Gilliamella sp. Choc6-1]|uniref:DUF2569 family protein n=1 Tax=unclassified Gilliamella TaxID=2685620 RepID=UPI003FA59EAC
MVFRLGYAVLMPLSIYLSFLILQSNFNFYDIKNTVRVIIYACIFITYILKSERVKNTFVNGRRSEITHSDIIS